MTYFETDRLKIRQLERSDLAEFLFYRSNPSIVLYQGFDVFDKSEAESFILEHSKRVVINDNEWTQLGIELKSDGKLIGDCAVKLSSDEKAEVGITISPVYQRMGYAKEALNGLVNYLRQQFKKKAIIGIVDSRNASSNLLMRGLGFILEQEVQNVPFKGGLCTEFNYRLDL